MYYKLFKNDKEVADEKLDEVKLENLNWGNMLDRAVLAACKSIEENNGCKLLGVFKQKENSVGVGTFFCRFYLPGIKVLVEVSFIILKVHDCMKVDSDFFSCAGSSENMHSFFTCYILIKLQKLCLCWCCDQMKEAGYEVMNGYYRV